ncbi:conjugal transfer protein TraN [Legionella anisa]|uniref:conjugal transfer protein TraN n=1 Tax=Legionella anisa TaxID=28082 RepID=UPI0010412FE1|nr:conjugal transfer protein TraN [Legionella anisa]
MNKLMWLFLLCSAAHASEVMTTYKEGEQIGSQQAHQPVDVLKSLDVRQFPGFQPNLPQEHYYQGVDHPDTQLNTDAKRIQKTNETAVAVQDSANQLPYYQINPHSETMTRLHQIADHGDEIMHGKNTSQTKCSLKPKECLYQWQERTCITDKKSNSCAKLIEQGCEQSFSVCTQYTQGQCLSFKQNYQCPLSQCSEYQLLCGKDAFCLEGQCSKHEYQEAKEEDFNKGVSSLSAAKAAAQGFNSKNLFIFTGQRMECSNNIAGIKNCCRDSGWGIDLNLVHCSESEKKLGKAKENKLVVATGGYCHKRIKFPGGSKCVSRHNTYCVFPSKLARIIQEQGRRNQLGISFGEGQYSNCSGITAQQLQLIHFDSINFSEFYDEVQANLNKPNQNKTTNQMKDRLQRFYQQGEPHA